jgi:hypothetical protein
MTFEQLILASSGASSGSTFETHLLNLGTGGGGPGQTIYNEVVEVDASVTTQVEAEAVVQPLTNVKAGVSELEVNVEVSDPVQVEVKIQSTEIEVDSCP